MRLVLSLSGRLGVEWKKKEKLIKDFGICRPTATIMKITKVQTLGTNCISCVESCVLYMPMRVHGNCPRLALAIMRGAISSHSNKG